jgi:hypothetical protein
MMGEVPSRFISYIQQVIWAKKYLPRKNEGFSEFILSSSIFIEYYYQLIDLTMSLKKMKNPKIHYLQGFLQ